VKPHDVAPTTRVMVLAIMVSMVAFLDSNVESLLADGAGEVRLEITVDVGGGVCTHALLVPARVTGTGFRGGPGRVERAAEIGDRAGPVVLGPVLAPRHRQLRRTASTWRPTRAARH
jgi:hypothetical protein